MLRGRDAALALLLHLHARGMLPGSVPGVGTRGWRPCCSTCTPAGCSRIGSRSGYARMEALQDMGRHVVSIDEDSHPDAVMVTYVR